MKTEIKIDASCSEPRAVIITDRVTDEVTRILRMLTQDRPNIMCGFRDDSAEILDISDIICIYASAGRVYARTSTGEFVLRQRIYEVEDRLDNTAFVRISVSEIVNLKKVRKLDFSRAGTIRVIFLDGSSSYASRRYVSKIKEVLGI